MAAAATAAARSPSDTLALRLQRSCPGASFPLLQPQDGALRAWAGFLTVRDCGGGAREYALRLEGLPGIGNGASDAFDAEADAAAPLARATLLPGAPLAALLGGALPALQRRLRASRSAADFLVELREAAAAALAVPPPPPAPPPAFLSALAAHLSALPPGAVAHVEAELTRLTLRVVDARARTHLLRLSLPPGYPTHAPTLTADFPAPLALPWRAGASTLADALAAGAAAAARHAWLWDALDALDASAWVLDPPLGAAPRAACHRRLSLGGAAALWLCLDARADVAAGAPMPPPALRVYGPEHGAAPRRAALASALAAWAPPPAAELARGGAWLHAWLARALGESLPPPPGAAGADADAAAPPECGICYAFACPGDARGAPPGVGCDNPRCGRPFHVPCLAEWLRADGGAAGGAGRAAFGTLFGACPYCSAPIAVAPDEA
jgi:E3 ubiquitin-protein ligase FANCL